jgi:hypothetical protein
MPVDSNRVIRRDPRLEGRVIGLASAGFDDFDLLLT